MQVLRRGFGFISKIILIYLGAEAWGKGQEEVRGQRAVLLSVAVFWILAKLHTG